MNRIKIIVISAFYLLMSTLLFSQEAVIINKTGFDLYNIYVSPTGMEDWSDDLQPFDVILKDSYRILDLKSYNGEFLFDFRFVDVDGDEYIKKNVDLNLHRKVVVTLDDLSYILDAEQVGRQDEWVVSVRNNTGGTVQELYISPHASNSWGGNLLENDFMENKSTRQFYMSGREEFIDYDIRMDSRDGKFVQEEVTLSNNVTIVITSADRE
ncbi:hypothetical protein [Spirochaeta isovalerica]|uniref:Uncharacterized protein n=1 Tax=Spirochaeta isovalerica TaxID=150 RepID=A0A841RCR4_9SPIO|nr:hypothetical protein [Spirochaeta isovalerica]MBB6480780.1 hypothetical protein [Spirochaeta isovalerica]